MSTADLFTHDFSSKSYPYLGTFDASSDSSSSNTPLATPKPGVVHDPLYYHHPGPPSSEGSASATVIDKSLPSYETTSPPTEQFPLVSSKSEQQLDHETATKQQRIQDERLTRHGQRNRPRLPPFARRRRKPGFGHADGRRRLTAAQCNPVTQLALSPLRLMIPLPPVRAPIELHDRTHKRQRTFSLGGLLLCPFYGVGQTKVAIPHHLHETGRRRQLSGTKDTDWPLERCLRTPCSRPGARPAKHSYEYERSYAYMLPRPQYDFLATPFRGLVVHGYEVSVPLTAENLQPMLRALAYGMGKVVVRLWCWMSDEEIQRQYRRIGFRQHHVEFLRKASGMGRPGQAEFEAEDLRRMEDTRVMASAAGA